MICPCKGCEAPKRHLACHDHCDEFKEWRKGLDEANESKRRYLSETVYSTYGAGIKKKRRIRNHIKNRSGGR